MACRRGSAFRTATFACRLKTCDNGVSLKEVFEVLSENSLILLVPEGKLLFSRVVSHAKTASHLNQASAPAFGDHVGTTGSVASDDDLGVSRGYSHDARVPCCEEKSGAAGLIDS